VVPAVRWSPLAPSEPCSGTTRGEGQRSAGREDRSSATYRPACPTIPSPSGAGFAANNHRPHHLAARSEDPSRRRASGINGALELLAPARRGSARSRATRNPVVNSVRGPRRRRPARARTAAAPLHRRPTHRSSTTAPARPKPRHGKRTSAALSPLVRELDALLAAPIWWGSPYPGAAPGRPARRRAGAAASTPHGVLFREQVGGGRWSRSAFAITNADSKAGPLAVRAFRQPVVIADERPARARVRSAWSNGPGGCSASARRRPAQLRRGSCTPTSTRRGNWSVSPGLRGRFAVSPGRSTETANCPVRTGR